MYACIHEIVRGFFEGVRGHENPPTTFRNPPYLGIRQWLNVLPRLRILTTANIHSLLQHLVAGDK